MPSIREMTAEETAIYKAGVADGLRVVDGLGDLLGEMMDRGTISLSARAEIDAWLEEALDNP